MRPTLKTTHRSLVHRLLIMIAGVTGIAAVFLPFVYNISPLMGFVESIKDIFRETWIFSLKDVWRLAVPFFLAVLISGGSLHWMISGTLSKTERWGGFILSLLIAGVTLSIFLCDLFAEFHQWVFGLAVMVPLMTGAFLVIRTIRVGTLRQFSPIMAMQTAYLANTLFCLIAFWGDWEIGAYCTLITAVSYGVQMVIISLNTDPSKQHHTENQSLTPDS